MHLEFIPTDAPDPADPDICFGVPPDQITTELFELCEEFLSHASPIVHAELRHFLDESGYRPGGLGWFLDAPGLQHPL